MTVSIYNSRRQRGYENGKERELDDLLNRYLDGNLSEEDARALSTQIEESAEVRERYWELASIHGMVEQTMQSVSPVSYTHLTLPTMFEV